MIDLDGTENKSNFGANAILAVSLANAKAAAAAKGMPLYEHISDLNGTTVNILCLCQWWTSSMVVSTQITTLISKNSWSTSWRTFSERSCAYGSEIFHHLAKVLKAKGMNTAVGDVGGYALNLESNAAALAAIKEAVEKAGTF